MSWQQVKTIFLTGASLAIFWLRSGLPSAMKAQNGEILLSAAISLKESFTEIGSLYERQTGNRVTFSFGASGQLEKQIEAGAPVDVFASAGQREMDQLQAKGMVERDSRVNFARNTLVLIVPSDSKLRLHSVSELTSPGVNKVAIGNPQTVPAGLYAHELLERMKIASQVESRLVFGENVRQVLDYVARGEADAGLVYATDVEVAAGRVAVAAQIPPDNYSAIRYPVAVVQGCRHLAAARSFVELLLGPAGAGVLKKHGFLSPK